MLSLADFTAPPHVIVYNADNEAGLRAFIAYHHDKILRETLGHVFVDALESGLSALPPLWVPGSYGVGQRVVFASDIYASTQPDNTNQPDTLIGWSREAPNRWLKLYEGEGFEVSGITHVWRGLRRALIPYVFAMYLRDFAINVAQLGTVVPKAENSEVVTPAQLIVRHYNDFVEQIREHYFRNYQYISAKIDVAGYLRGYLYFHRDRFDPDVTPYGFADFEAYLIINYCHPFYMNSMNL